MADTSKPWSPVPCLCSSQPSSRFSSSSSPHRSQAFLLKTLLCHGKFCSWKVPGLGPGAGAAGSPWRGPFAPRLGGCPVPGARGGAVGALLTGSCPLSPRHKTQRGCLCRTLRLPQPPRAFSHGHTWNRLCFYNHLYAILSFLFCSAPASSHRIPPLSPAKVSQAGVCGSPCKAFPAPLSPAPGWEGSPSLVWSGLILHLLQAPSLLAPMLGIAPARAVSSRKPTAAGRGRRGQLCFSYGRIPNFWHSSSSLLSCWHRAAPRGPLTSGSGHKMAAVSEEHQLRARRAEPVFLSQGKKEPRVSSLAAAALMRLSPPLRHR